MNIAQAHLEALKALGYKEVEARFLYLVATHSGYFTARQFLMFAGAHWGKRTTTFWNKLHGLRHARTESFLKGGVVHHLSRAHCTAESRRKTCGTGGSMSSASSNAASPFSISFS
jgi:hypothetical protein